MSKQKQPSRRFVLTIAVSVFAALAVIGSTQAESTKTGRTSGNGGAFNVPQIQGTPRAGGSITVAVPAAYPEVDPAVAGDTLTHAAVYDTLITWDAKGNWAPDLATSWKANSTHTVWTIALRHGVRFTDGTPFNAKAVVAHFGRLIRLKSSVAPVQTLQSMRARGKYTVVFTLKAPNAWFPKQFLLPGGGEGLIESPTAVAKWGDAKYGLHPVGTGPFILTKGAGTSSEILKRNPHYWQVDSHGRHLPYLSQVKVVAVPNSATAYAALQSGQVNLIETTDTSIVANAVKAGKWGVQKISGGSTDVTLFNTKKPPFNDLRMRQAFTDAISRHAINGVLFGGARSETASLLDPESPYYVKENWGTYDPAKAKQLVAAAAAAGVPTAFDYTCLNAGAFPGELSLMKQQLAAVGLTMNIKYEDQATYVGGLLSKSGDYQAGCFTIPGPAGPDDLYNLFHTGGFENVVFYSNPAVDAATQKIVNTSSPKTVKAQAAVVQKQVAHDLPWSILLPGLGANIYKPTMSGLSNGLYQGPNPQNLYLKK